MTKIVPENTLGLPQKISKEEIEERLSQLEAPPKINHEEASISSHLLGSEKDGTYVEIFADPKRDPFHEKIWVNKPKIIEGYINTPAEAGLGINLDWDLIKKYS